ERLVAEQVADRALDLVDDPHPASRPGILHGFDPERLRPRLLRGIEDGDPIPMLVPVVTKLPAQALRHGTQVDPRAVNRRKSMVSGMQADATMVRLKPSKIEGFRSE